MASITSSYFIVDYDQYHCPGYAFIRPTIALSHDRHAFLCAAPVHCALPLYLLLDGSLCPIEEVMLQHISIVSNKPCNICVDHCEAP